MHVPILARLARLSAGGTALACIAATMLVAALALIVVDPAPADHDDSIHFPAETMTYGSFAKVVSDPSAFGGEALLYADAGIATRSITLAAEGERIFFGRATLPRPVPSPMWAYG